MIYILTAVHNRISATKIFLECLKNQSEKDFQLVVVDDGSTDGTSEIVKKILPDAEIIFGDGTYWWTKSLNIGLAKILTTAKDDDLVIFINADVYFDKDYLRVIGHYCKKNQAIVGSYCYDYFNRKKLLRSGIRIDKKTLTRQMSSTNFDTLSTRGTIVPVKYIRQIGWFDEHNFPHYTSDYDYFYRAKKLGIKLMLASQAMIFTKNDHTGSKPRLVKLFDIKTPGNLPNETKFIIKHSQNLKWRLINLTRYLVSLVKNYYQVEKSLD